MGKNAETTTGRRLTLRMLCAAGLAVALGLVLAGCGGDDGGGRAQEAQPADPAYAARANAVCAEALAQTRRLGEAASRSRAGAGDPLALTTERLVEPGLVIRERLANRLRALPAPQRGAATVAVYLELFDPLEVLTRERLRVGREGDLEGAQRLEGLMRGLAAEQRAAAQQAGLETCAADFVAAAFPPAS